MFPFLWPLTPPEVKEVLGCVGNTSQLILHMVQLLMMPFFLNLTLLVLNLEWSGVWDSFSDSFKSIILSSSKDVMSRKSGSSIYRSFGAHCVGFTLLNWRALLFRCRCATCLFFSAGKENAKTLEPSVHWYPWAFLSFRKKELKTKQIGSRKIDIHFA